MTEHVDKRTSFADRNVVLYVKNNAGRWVSCSQEEAAKAHQNKNPAGSVNSKLALPEKVESKGPAKVIVAKRKRDEKSDSKKEMIKVQRGFGIGTATPGKAKVLKLSVVKTYATKSPEGQAMLFWIKLFTCDTNDPN